MEWFSNLKIGKKLLLSFILIAIISGLMGVFGIVALKNISQNSNNMYGKMTVPLERLLRISVAFERVKLNSSEMVNVQNPNEIQDHITKIKQDSADIDSLTKEFSTMTNSDQMRNLFQEFQASWSNYKNQLDKEIALVQSNRNAEAIALLSQNGDLGKASLSTENLLTKMKDLKLTHAKDMADINNATANNSSILMVIIVLITLFLAILLGIFISKIISNPLRKTQELLNEMSKGHFSNRLRITANDEIGQMAKALDAFSDEMQKVFIGSLNKIAEGDLNLQIVQKDDKDEITPVIKKTVENINALLLETNNLIQATKEGKLDTRGNAAAFTGGWGQLIGGVNEMIDSFVGPINVTAEYVDRISKGDIPPKITDAYYGDFNEIKNNLNSCIDIMNGLLLETNNLIQATKEGKLDTRGNAAAFTGGWGQLIGGVNDLIEAIIEPIKEAAEVLAEMSKGNLSVMVKGDYKGDNAKIKNSLNDTISALSSYIKEISEVLTQIAQGNLDLEIRADYRGDFSSIKDSINNILDSLNEIIGDFNNAASQVSSGSNQVASSAQSLSQGATEQASAIEELTASLEEISGQTKKNSEDAVVANNLATEAKNDAVVGNGQMQEMLKSMDEINESSNNISKIIKVIDEIAFQTNTLALNAAVEAARAGQHGKGFAVVAEEVRNLATRSANAAKETTLLIEGSIKKVEVGTKIANETADALNKIVEGVSKAASLVSSIANASNEQAQAINQVNQGIQQVSIVVQNNSATSEEIAASSEELSSQSEILKEQANRFKLKKSKKVSYSEIGDLPDDVLQLIQSMNKAKKSGNSMSGQDERKKNTSKKPKIDLNDHDFGKY